MTPFADVSPGWRNADSPCLVGHPATAAVPYLVDHDASCIYMERVHGHSIKSVLRQGVLAASGACTAMPFAPGPDACPLAVNTLWLRHMQS